MPVTVPNVGKVVWSGFAQTGKAGGALVPGDFVVSTDGVSFNKTATKSYASVKGVVADDGIKTSFATGDVITVVLFGVVAVTGKGALAAGDLVQNDVTDAGKVLKYAIGSDTVETGQQAVAGRVLLGGTDTTILLFVGSR